MDEVPKRLNGGELSAAISNAVVAVTARVTGRGPTRSRAFVHDDVVVCILEDTMTRVEHSLVALGEDQIVSDVRHAFAHAAHDDLIAEIQRLTGRTVLTFLSATDTIADTYAQLFILAPGPPAA